MRRALMALAAPGNEPADTDSVSYWRAYAAEADADEELEAKTARFATDSAAAYGRPAGLLRHWTHLSAAAVSAAARSDPELTVATQGLRLGTDDFLQTLVVEATLHHLDLVRYLAGVPGPAAANLALTRATVEALLGVPTPPDWDDRSTAWWLTGREAPPPTGHKCWLDRAKMQPRAGSNAASSGQECRLERAGLSCRAGTNVRSTGRRCTADGATMQVRACPRVGRRR